MSWCLPQEFVPRFIKGLKDGTLDPAGLMDMTSAERRDLFGQILGEDHASQVNAAFESKMLLKDQQRGMITWIKQMSNMKDKVARDMIARISRMDTILQPAEEDSFLQDLASQKLRTGSLVSADEAQKIYDLSKTAMAARDAETTNLSGVSDEYLKASREFHQYINSLKPTTPMASIGKNAGTVARNMLLMNPSTPIKTVVGDVVNSTMDYFTRRLGVGELSGINPELRSAAASEAWQTYLNTGQNITSMESLDDFGRLGEGSNFAVKTGADSGGVVTQAVEAGVRKVAQVTNKVIIDWAHVAPFNYFHQKAFYDMSDLMSSKIAAGEGLEGLAAQERAAEIFKDASRIEPLLDEGKIVRAAAQAQAARVTSVNDTLTARFALGVKDAVNRAVPGVGDALMPIAKIPANIIWNGIENAGPGIPLGVKDIFQGRALMQSTSEATRYQGMAQFAGGVQKVARTAGTIGAAAFFASLMGPEDFRQDRFGANYAKIGGLWVNMEYVAAISPALAGMMTAKQHQAEGGGLLADAAHYASGALTGLKNLPGISEVEDIIGRVTSADYSKGLKDYAVNFIRSRTIPPILWNLFQNRPVNRILFGAHGVESPLQVTEDKWPKARMSMTPWGDPDQGMPHSEADPTNQILFGLGYAPGFPAQTINGVKLTDQQYQSYIQQSGVQAKQLLDVSTQDPNWQQMPKPWQLNDVKRTIRQARKDAATSIMAENPDIIIKSQARKDAELGIDDSQFNDMGNSGMNEPTGAR